MLSGTVSAGLGFSAATVPFCTFGLLLCFLPCWCVVEIVRLRESSDSIFFRIACADEEVCSSTSNETLRVETRRRGLPLVDSAEGRDGKEALAPTELDAGMVLRQNNKKKRDQQPHV